MFVDTHMHEMTCSKDSFLKLEEMVEIAREKRSRCNLHHGP